MFRLQLFFKKSFGDLLLEIFGNELYIYLLNLVCNGQIDYAFKNEEKTLTPFQLLFFSNCSFSVYFSLLC